MGRVDEAITYAEASVGMNDSHVFMARTCEEILLAADRCEEAYERWAMTANEGMSHIATFRALAKKYPHKEKAAILADLIRSTPGEEGKLLA